MKKSFTPLLWLICSTLFVAGCSSYDAKTIAVGLSVELTGIERASDGTVAVTWNLVNPNVASYLLTRVSNKIYLDGNLVGTALDTNPMAFPAQQSVSKVTRLTLAGPEGERRIAAAAGRGHAAYRVETQIIIQLYGETTEKGTLVHSGSVQVTGK